MRTLKLMWRLIKYRPWLYLLNMVLWAIIEVFPVLPTLIVKVLLDSFGANLGLTEEFWWFVVGIAAVYFGRIAFTYAGTSSYVYYSFSSTSLMRQNLLKAILKRPGAQALSFSPSEALNRLRDDVQGVDELVGWPMDVFGKFLCALTSVAILLTVNVQVTLVIFIPLFIILVLIQQVKKRVSRYREASREATSQVVGAIGEIFSSVQAIQVANAEEHVLAHFRKLNQGRHQAMLKDTLFLKVLEAVMNNVVYVGTGLIMILAAQYLRSGELSIGDFALFISYWSYVADFTNNFGHLLSSYHQARVSTERLAEMVEGEPADTLAKHEPLYLKGSLPGAEGCASVSDESLQSLEIRNLSYRFPSSGSGIQNVSFTVPGGSFTVITGRVGSGKSTLLRVLLGLLPSDQGTILWNGRVVEEPATFFVPPRSAYTAQVPHLFSDTVRQNILLGRWDETYDVGPAVHAAVLEQDLTELEKGLETMIGPRGVKLSGGQLQRVAAARMFANEAQLYLFDDISSALDVETENLLWNRLFTQPHVTCIAVSNRRAALQQADHIIVLKDGQIVGEGRLDELLENCEEMQQIYGRNAQTA